MLTNVEYIVYNKNMDLIKKLTEKKEQENQETLLDECLLNEEVIPATNEVSDSILNHPEGEYIRKEDGIYVRYVVRENKPCKNEIENNEELSK